MINAAGRRLVSDLWWRHSIKIQSCNLWKQTDFITVCVYHLHLNTALLPDEDKSSSSAGSTWNIWKSPAGGGQSLTCSAKRVGGMMCWYEQIIIR